MTVLITLRDGSQIQVDDLSATRAKHLRRTGGSIAIRSGNKKNVLNGSDIKAIESVPSDA